MTKQSSPSKPFLSTTVLLLLGIAWGFITLMFFLLFSVPPEGGENPGWYFVGITILEIGAFVAASLMCFRNWQSGQIVSGRTVWMLIGVGLMSYALGNVLFYIWGNVWGRDPTVSIGDFFYLLAYVFLALGMLQAVLPRRLNLEFQQWLIVALIGVLGVAIAYFLNYQVAAEEADIALPAPAPIEQVAPADPAAPVDPAAEQSPTPSLPEPTDSVSAPEWVLQLDTQLEPFGDFVSSLYVIGDCILLVVAATLLVAFWGGRTSQSWKLIAFAAFCLYIADMFFAFYVRQSDYQEGQLWEVFWTFSALFFGLGAVVEHAVSSRSRRTSRRRRS